MLSFTYVTMAQKRGPDEEKSYFEFLAFLVLYYINKACVKIVWQYQTITLLQNTSYWFIFNSFLKIIKLLPLYVILLCAIKMSTISINYTHHNFNEVFPFNVFWMCPVVNLLCSVVINWSLTSLLKHLHWPKFQFSN